MEKKKGIKWVRNGRKAKIFLATRQKKRKIPGWACALWPVGWSNGPLVGPSGQYYGHMAYQPCCAAKCVGARWRVLSLQIALHLSQLSEATDEANKGISRINSSKTRVKGMTKGLSSTVDNLLLNAIDVISMANISRIIKLIISQRDL